jgi:hypothetical protein
VAAGRTAGLAAAAGAGDDATDLDKSNIFNFFFSKFQNIKFFFFW